MLCPLIRKTFVQRFSARLCSLAPESTIMRGDTTRKIAYLLNHVTVVVGIFESITMDIQRSYETPQ